MQSSHRTFLHLPVAKEAGFMGILFLVSFGCSWWYSSYQANVPFACTLGYCQEIKNEI